MPTVNERGAAATRTPPAGPPDAQLALARYRRLAPVYDETTAWLAPYRQRAVASLALQPGETVVSVGCGTGPCFPLIAPAIGPQGRLLGIELSAAMLTKARARVEAGGWRNVSLIWSKAEEAEIPSRADAFLFAFTHDIVRSPAALANVFRAGKAGARVAAVGPKWSWWAPLNLASWAVARQFVTTFEGFERPWSELARFVPDLLVEPAHFDTIYLARGTLAGAR